MIVRHFQNNAVTLSGAYQVVSNHPLKSVYLDGVRLPAPPSVFTWAKLQSCSQRRSERSHKRLWTLAFLNVSTGHDFFRFNTCARAENRFGTVRSESPHECGTSIDFNRWLRIRVAFGVLSGLPAPTGDHLASLHGFVHDLLSGNPATCTAQPNPARRPGGGLIGRLAFSAPSMAFTSLTFPARYRSNQGAGLRLPANVSRNTPATEAGGL